MKKNNIVTIIALVCLLGSISCVRQEMEVTLDTSDNLERVPVTLSLDVTRLEDGTPGTKTTQEPDEPGVTSDSQIKDFVVLQFGGTTSSAQLVGGQVYFDHWPLNGYRATTDPLYDENDVLTLVASATPNTVVVLANTFGRITINNSTTLGEFLSTDFTNISGLSEVLTTSGSDDYLRLSGSTKQNTVSIGDNVSVSLRRNVAKIIVNVTNLTHTNGSTDDNIVTLSNVHLKGINSKYYYLAHVEAALDPLTFTDNYSQADPCRFDNPTEEFPSANNASGATVTYTYYVPANLRGTTGSTSQSTKAVGAPAGATCFSLYGTYGSSNIPIAYTYYLGENLTNDFNLKPNYKYTYNITINEKGNADYDHCIEDLKEIRFATDANCYMVHPPKGDGQARIYAFPVRRAAVFWNTEAQGGLYGGNSTLEGYDSYVLEGTTSWAPEILWSDFDMSAYMSGASKFLAVDSGTGFDPANPAHTQPYIKVRISSGMSGNVVVGMRSTSGASSGAILWSWHIWITDYDPDVPMTPVEHQYIYGVPGGEIHRYNNAMWNTTATESAHGFANGFAMDRNLGARNTIYGTFNGNGFFYEFGRKDPFSQSYYFYLGGVTHTGALSDGRRKTGVSIREDMKNIRYSVLNPTVYIYASSDNSNWTVISDDVGEDGVQRYWNDKLYYRPGDPNRHELKKSIYDPCPPGWKVPIQPVFAGFNHETTANSAAQTYTTVWADTGRYYYPEGYVNRETTGKIFIPAAGLRYRTDGGISNVGTYGLLCTATPSTTLFRRFEFNQSMVNPDVGYFRSEALPVRCVHE